MNVRLLYRDHDFSMQTPGFGQQALAADLEMERILSAMAGGDPLLHDVCANLLFHPLQTEGEIRYRQDVLADCIRNPETVRELYGITVETQKRKSESWSWVSSGQYLSSNFSSAINLLRIYAEMLLKLRNTLGGDSQKFRSDGWRQLIGMLWRELDDDYFSQISALLDELKDDRGILISAELGSYCQGVHYVMRRKEEKRFWRNWHFAPSFTISPRDDAGASDLGKRRDRAINESTNVLAQSADHIENFFAVLQRELAFYVGCLNLFDRMKELGMPAAIPELLPLSSESRRFEDLYDVSLALTKNAKVVGNQLCAENKRLYLITGANQGGKSTFLRSIGQSQLMMQCGMFVGAGSFQAPVRRGIFTHFKKEEDAGMKSGKLDEELSRMNGIADHLVPGSLLLFNESFAATNEREGSEICRQITTALIENGIEVFSVTHLYSFAAGFFHDNQPDVVYLAAQRLDDGSRTFRIVPGEPLQTAYGEDLYRKIFGAQAKNGK